MQPHKHIIDVIDVQKNLRRRRRGVTFPAAREALSGNSPRGGAQRIWIAGKKRRRVVLERKYGEEERHRRRSKDASNARAEFSDRA